MSEPTVNGYIFTGLEAQTYDSHNLSVVAYATGVNEARSYLKHLGYRVKYVGIETRSDHSRENALAVSCVGWKTKLEAEVNAMRNAPLLPRIRGIVVGPYCPYTSYAVLAP